MKMTNTSMSAASLGLGAFVSNTNSMVSNTEIAKLGDDMI